ncbi:MAG: putative monovalent cation/H+ antiporter subunit A [Devosia sp.]
MDLSLDIAVAAVAIAPFVAALLAPSVQRAFGALSGWILALVPALIFVFLSSFIAPVASGQPVAASLDWAPVHGLGLSFLIDGLSLTFALMISGIGTFILIYSGAYLKGHPHQGRFLSFMLMFMGAMLGLVLADSMVALYAFWELTTVTSFLLIGFDHTRQVARRAAIQALVVTGIGGLALLAAAILMQRLTGSWEFSGLEAFDLRAHAAYPVMLVLILLAAFTKSAQLPFHFWLPNAMEAPTPVSAFLHSATMVQGGVYLLARLNPALGGTPMWSTALVAFGGATLIWGGIAALRQTDLKQMLAQTTIASLGLLVLLIGIGTETAITAAVLYFAAHALYKAALFLVVGIIDHETGTRDITALSGLRDALTVTFIATVLAVVSMIGLPPLIGYLAKEEMYAALLTDAWQPLLVLGVLIIGNALLAGVALAVLIKPFMGTPVPLPKEPHEASIGLLVGPALFAVLGIVAGFMTSWIGAMLVAPAASVIAGAGIEGHLAPGLDPLAPLFWLSVLTWLLGGLVYWKLDIIRTVLRRGQIAVGWSFDKGFDALMFGLIRLAGAVTRTWHHGQLELYLVVLFLMFALAIVVPLWSLGGLPALPEAVELTFYEWGVVLIAIIGIATVVAARTRLFAILALGIQGFAVALLYLLFGAPDLSFTQFMVEILSVVILTLVMTRLRLDRQDLRQFEDLVRDGGLALICGLGVTTLLFAVIQGALDSRLSDFFNANSAAVAHGRNIVNVILVDFRGLDTLGEISVVMTAGIAILALIRGASKPRAPAAPDASPPRGGRSRPRAEAAP